MSKDITPHEALPQRAERTESGAIDATCVLCGTKISVPIGDGQYAVQTASQQAIELHLYHRAHHHPKEDRDADHTPTPS